MMFRSNSKRDSAKKPTVINRSWTIATIVDTPNCHSNRTIANRPMPRIARTTASTPLRISSPDTLLDTVE
ncbi:hypothetical protein WR25_04092 [Diploscapter pachys]|uniref:Uncharacterized protein n=1 Tax=Diploscapter pachys TaxID=2018661 RepID=A0A2A2M5I1_9BILA|nr:hypothetical protein WR25_04092 [Diploscapter pachys]